VLDPISQFVDPLPDAFGPGLDVEWSSPAFGSRFLTLDDADADECEYGANERLIRLIPSKNAPYFLLPGETGTLVYRVIVK